MVSAGEATPQDPRGTYQSLDDAVCSQYSNRPYSTPELLLPNASHASVGDPVEQADLREPFTGRTSARYVARPKEWKGGGLEEIQ